MATGIPTFRVDLAEGMIDVDTSADRLFAYCIEADKGPVNTPTFVASNKEAMRIFGVDFAPHFYQNPTGLVLTRVGFTDMAPGQIEYKGLVEVPIKDEEGNVTGTKLEDKVLLTIKATSPGPCKHKVKVAQALVGDGLSLTVDIDGVTSKNYQNLKSLKKVAERINNRFSNYLVATLNKDFDEATFKNENFNVVVTQESGKEKKVPRKTTGELLGGTNGYMLDTTGNKAGAGFTEVVVTENSVEGFTGNKYFIDSNAKVETAERYPLFSDAGKTKTGMYVAITGETEVEGETFYSFTSYGAIDATEPLATGKVKLTGEVGTKYTEVDDEEQGINVPPVEGQPDDKPNADITRIAAYREAFDKTAYVDVIGVAALSDSKVVRNVLVEHINYMVDPEVHSFRFGVTSILTSDAQENDGVNSIESIKAVAEFINSEWIICIGQGVVFQKENEAPVELKPYQAIQLYTGIRSSLGYSESIFGGEQKKVLKGVIDTLPLVNDGTTVIKDDIIELNEAGICTFKKEYNEITFVEGVTTIQDEDVMSYENMMSIIAYVIRRLVTIAKPYQGQRLTEDLKSTLQTALSSELNTITSSDGTLMALEDFNIPPYDVQVYSAGKTKFDETNRLVRESKIIIQVRIVPIGALRDIDLHVIAI